MVDRRQFLQAVGGGVAVTGVTVGGASAHTAAYTDADDQDGTENSPEEIVEELDPEERVNRVHGHVGAAPDVSIGYVSPNDRLDVPDLRMADGPVGVRHPQLYDGRSLEPEDLEEGDDDLVLAGLSGGPSTAFPASVGQIATWNENLLREVGTAMGREAKAKKQDVVLGPGFNIVRVPTLGRAFEYFGEDPYLAGRGAVEVTRGIQSAGTIACAKHYVANNQEEARMTVSADVDERALREIYLRAFRDCVREAEVGAIMGAYNRVNGTYACEHEHLLGDILKDEWGFDGFVVSDWFATRSTVDAANAGLDLEMPFGDHFGEDLEAAVSAGDVAEETLDEMALRPLARMARFGMLEGDRRGPPGEANTDRHQQLSRRVATEGAVLLRNESAALPIDEDEVTNVAVVGPTADEAKVGGGGSSNITPPYEVSPLEGIRGAVGPDTTVTYAPGEIREDARAAAAAADVAIVFGEAESVENADREDMHLDDDHDEIIETVADAADRTIVVLNTGTPVVMPWLDDVSAVLQMWYPGMEDGNATADVLFGAADPGGKLPVTFGKRFEDYPATSEEQYPGVDRGDGYPVADYSEGIYVGYRHFDEHDIVPLFPFGHGISYAEFTYEDAEVPDVVSACEHATVRVTLENAGDRSGAEVVQAYVGRDDTGVDRPQKELAGFEKVSLVAGERETVEIELDSDAFAYYDPDAREWTTESGPYDVFIGSSSRDIRLTESTTVTGN